MRVVLENLDTFENGFGVLGRREVQAFCRNVIQFRQIIVIPVSLSHFIDDMLANRFQEGLGGGDCTFWIGSPPVERLFPGIMHAASSKEISVCEISSSAGCTPVAVIHALHMPDSPRCAWMRQECIRRAVGWG